MSEWVTITLAVLLPVAYLFGWLLARKQYSKKQEENSVSFNPEYLRGLNYLLDEQQDKAIELFVKLLDVDDATIELHLTLGSLFRRKGETDKAIRLHQNILARPDLDAPKRAIVIYELACDFMASGLLDRAESLFIDLLEDKALVSKSEASLLNIYEKEKEWHNAIEMASRLAKYNSKKYYPQIAHYYCELLSEGMGTNRSSEQDSIIQKAYSYDPRSVRVRYLEGKMLIERGHYKKAITVFLQIEKQDHDFFPIVVSDIFYALDNLGQTEKTETIIREFKTKYCCTSAVLALTRYLFSLQRDDEAKEYLLDNLVKHPSLRLLNEWVKLELKSCGDNNKQSIKIIYDMLDNYLESLSQFKCSTCGYKSNVLEWQCPSCQSWGSVKPVYGVSGE